MFVNNYPKYTQSFEVKPVIFIVSILPILRWLSKIILQGWYIKAPIFIRTYYNISLRAQGNCFGCSILPLYYFVEIVFELRKWLYNTFSMLIELINCNKITVSLHFAHFRLSHSYVYSCKTVSSFSTLACRAVFFARTLINSLHALYTFGIVIQIGTQSCDNGFFDS